MPHAQISDDVSLFYTEHGKGGPPILLVHGWACDSGDWMWQIPDLAERHKVYVVDLRGHGHSSVTKDCYRGTDYAQDLSRLIEVLGCGPAIVIGHSLGGYIGVHLAVEHPEHVLALVCVDPAYAPSMAAPDPSELISALRSESCHGLMEQLFTSFADASTPAFLTTWHLRRLLTVPRHVISESIAGMTTNNVVNVDQAMLRLRSCPTLTFFRSADDSAWEDAAAGTGPGMTMTWDGAGHWLHQERPIEFNAIVTKWIDEIC
ncbi:alpha/beta hydrolase (plasmid) [Rhodococcus erythropolis]|uniref:alpha/beta fold hydrolase n=1 Tax=Rhodococcus TaxID=1827 RepID=UPI00124425E1|nr:MULTISPECIES: alpha/beta hydrolase [Rhodococcus]MCJ0949903.1 alpha/beta hydrolase [Rhodococcus sp. ARC_M8]MCQ4152101.1 alpha/beta hydrolase [Rhodococcus qingshengii]MDJ0441227.1 alpha/beta hydrolase [Rhodococcus qingshengii]QEX08437.1 alpha/beta hydrolase [Rhodococcus erythropolis]